MTPSRTETRVRSAGASRRKALIAAVGFFLVGVVSWTYTNGNSVSSLPLAIFYGTLVVNTYFSIKLFSRITPIETAYQETLDFILGLLYLALALSFENPFNFMFLAFLLFVVATVKYACLLNIAGHPRLLKRKILVDLAGTTACGLAFMGIAAGYALMSLWLFCIIFVVANILLFFIWPLYRPDEPLDERGF